MVSAAGGRRRDGPRAQSTPGGASRFRLEPRRPVVGRVAEAHAVASPVERRAQEPRLRQRALEHALGRAAADVQRQRAEPRVLAIDQGGGAELFLESPQLATGGRPLVQIDEVHGEPALGKEAQRLARVLTVLETEDLDVHALARAARACTPSQALKGTAGVPGGFVRPVCGPW